MKLIGLPCNSKSLTHWSPNPGKKAQCIPSGPTFFCFFIMCFVQNCHGTVFIYLKMIMPPSAVSTIFLSKNGWTVFVITVLLNNVLTAEMSMQKNTVTTHNHFACYVVVRSHKIITICCVLIATWDLIFCGLLYSDHNARPLAKHCYKCHLLQSYPDCWCALKECCVSLLIT